MIKFLTWLNRIILTHLQIAVCYHYNRILAFLTNKIGTTLLRLANCRNSQYQQYIVDVYCILGFTDEGWKKMCEFKRNNDTHVDFNIEDVYSLVEAVCA